MESSAAPNRRAGLAALEPLAFDVPAFCAAHGISRALLYIMLRDGRGPAIIKAGRRTLISHEAAARWRREMEVRSAK